jgi:short-subunit dehydrogenase
MALLTGQTALVTGASMGLGREYARLFAADGHNLVLVARSDDKLRLLAAELGAEHRVSVRVLPADLADPESPERIFDALARDHVEIEFLVNNAGFGLNGAFAELDGARQLEIVQVNVAALTALCRLFLPSMIARGHGRILNVASVAAFQPGPGMAVYFASKAYVLSLSEALAHELSATGVTVTCHCPGATATEFAGKADLLNSKLFKMGVAGPADVARHGYRAMMKGRVVSIHGPVNWVAAQSVRFGFRPAVRSVSAWVNSK